MSCGCRGDRCRIGADDPRHGSVNAYKNQKCRCTDCREANTTYFRVGPGKEFKKRYQEAASYRRPSRIPRGPRG